MTETTTPLASRTYDEHTAGRLTAFEYETEPFTDPELDAIERYEERTIGIPDCFDGAFDSALGSIPEEFGEADKVAMIKSHFGMLGAWREAIGDLRGELGDIGAIRTAASRYVGAELVSWHQAREAWRSGTIEHYLGRDEHGLSFDGRRQVEGSRFVDGLFWINA